MYINKLDIEIIEARNVTIDRIKAAQGMDGG